MRSDDPLFLTPEGRLSELSRIFAAGILRLRSRAIPLDSTKTQNSAHPRLELPPEIVLSVHSG